MVMEAMAYFCEFCSKLYPTKQLCEYHENMCRKNPSMKTCDTCSGMLLVKCKHGINITNTECNGIATVVGCSVWKENNHGKGLCGSGMV